jgi:DNA-binding GntR family transcriptional regulator
MNSNKKKSIIELHEVIKNKILNGNINLGEKINSKELANEFDVSLMTIRCALNKLVNEGFLINNPSKGIYVEDYTKKKIIDILESKKIKELYCLDKYFVNINKEKIKELKNSFIKEDNINFINHDSKLHSLIVESSQNNYLINEFNKIQNHYIILFNYLNNGNELFRKEHLNLISNILHDNKEKSCQILKCHFKRLDNFIYDIIKKDIN